MRQELQGDKSVQGYIFSLIVKETAFEFLPLQKLLVLPPREPETTTVVLSGGLKTKTSTVPGAAMSGAVIAATS
jgi:hypothetical protein